MYDLVKSETKTLMLANGRVEYAFRVVDPAVPPATRSKPKRAEIVLFAVAVGFIFSSIVVIAYFRFRDTRAITGTAPAIKSSV
jgi:LPS O-antigen subunit length determinant protein (WzzB/FepE family)